ncbi:hypothetical protein B0T18DRAFT_385143 [Schizothecium vesticola]|uniref:Acid protease n=1 Tax=Schizothecium vesticola TaxID=314040 RepID=A0AA40F8J9_9PEZI|nr:hypothetical protein B0T18DRAFT_385143 [Schizothecium vesticola]
MSLGRFITALSVVALGGRASAATPGVLQIPFTSDALVSLNDPGGQYGGPGQMTYGQAHNQASMGRYGPDGPWQAVAISVGDFALKESTRNPYSGVWPVIGGVTFLLGGQAGGNYTAQASQRKQSVSFRPDPSTYFTNAIMTYDGQTSAESAALVTANSSVGQLSVHRLLGASDYESFNFTAEVVEMTVWEISLRNGGKYTPKTGLLGMKAVLNSLTGNVCTTACTKEDFKNIGVIGSRTFSLHIGSVSTIIGQQGSFALGGYEQTRIVGPVGVFDLMDDMPVVFLRDLFLGVESGYSPFLTDRADNISVFTGLPLGDVRSAELNSKLRASQGSVVLTPSAAAPGIYLPRYLCEGLAPYLPVIHDPSTGYYLWDTASPFYNVVVNSAGYLGFVISDRNARNITIKVPFILLDLDLEPPLVPVTTKYFPCHPLPSSPGGHWLLGRAFLQAAFFGYSLDQNVSYLAQAPGPDVEQSVVRAWRPESVGVPEDSSLPLDAFYRSWWRHMFRLNTPLDPVSGVPLRATGGGGLRRGKRGGGGAVELGLGGTEVVELGDEKEKEVGVVERKEQVSD